MWTRVTRVARVAKEENVHDEKKNPQKVGTWSNKYTLKHFIIFKDSTQLIGYVEKRLLAKRKT